MTPTLLKISDIFPTHDVSYPASLRSSIAVLPVGDKAKSCLLGVLLKLVLSVPMNGRAIILPNLYSGLLQISLAISQYLYSSGTGITSS